MRVKKSQLATLAMAVSAAFSGAAFAGPDYAASSPVATTYASELRGTTGNTVFANSAYSATPSSVTGTLNFQFAIGFGASATQNRYVRVELPTGVTFSSTDPALSTNAATTNTTLVAGGSGQNFAVWQLTAAAGGMAGSQTFIVSPSSVTATSGYTGAVTVRVTTHETAVSATGANNAVLATPVNSATYLTFASTISASVTASAASTLQASGNFQNFCTNSSCSATTNVISLGSLNTVLATANVVPSSTSGASAVATDILGTASAIRVRPLTGASFSAGAVSASLYLAASTGCGTGVGAAVAISGGTSAVSVSTATTAATFTVGTNVTGTGSAAAYTLCYAGAGTTSLPDLNSFSISYEPVFAGATSQAGISPTSTSGSGTAGTSLGWLREGVTLQAPWMPFAQTGVTSRIFMTNTGSGSVACTARVVNDATGTTTASVTYTGGSTGGFAFSIPAGNSAGPAIVEVPVNASSTTTAIQPMLSAFTGNPRGVIAVTCIAPSNTIQGNAQLTFTTSGTAVMTPMLRAGSN